MRSEKMKKDSLDKRDRALSSSEEREAMCRLGSFEGVPTGGVCFLMNYEVIN